MNTTCKNSSDSMHRFHSFIVPGEFKTAPFRVHSFHTCITCGHQRAVDVCGVLYYFDNSNGKWVAVRDAVEEVLQ